GREFSEAGLMFYRARFYSPGIGKFVSEDPLRFAAGVNFYSYVLNDPINFIDPNGLIMIDADAQADYQPWREIRPDFKPDHLVLDLEPETEAQVECFAQCVQDNRLDWGNLFTTFNIANPTANLLVGPTGRTGIGGTTSHATSWQHKVGSKISPAASGVGRAIGRYSLVTTVFEGFYDIGTIGRCIAICKKDGCEGN
ncbi:MAG: RHS repeat-associated core domain-containing protein, partial [Anaerolineae bacterium]|nr:RHS repeat-associated core domain-containing protein [Anaerolineae bacterium]